MNMPGFTAETSLYRESGRYRMAGAYTHADGAIQSAIYRDYSYASCRSYCRDFCWPDPVGLARCRPGKDPECYCI
jgi:hypothetical protein